MVAVRCCGRRSQYLVRRSRDLICCCFLEGILLAAAVEHLLLDLVGDRLPVSSLLALMAVRMKAVVMGEVCRIGSSRRRARKHLSSRQESYFPRSLPRNGLRTVASLLSISAALLPIPASAAVSIPSAIRI